jgi:hypothetical protein
MVRLNESIKQELNTWTVWLKKNQPRSLLKPPLPQVIIMTDAAPTGWGATIHSTSSIPTPDNSLEAMRGMVFNNVSSFQQQAGISSHSQSVGRIFSNYY